MIVLVPFWLKKSISNISFFPQIHPTTTGCSCALSCNSDHSAPVCKQQPSCIHSINVRGDMEFLLFCLGRKRQSQIDTRSRPFSLLLWDEVFVFFFLSFILFCISKLLASKGRTSLDERRLCGAEGGRSILLTPSLSLSSICISRCSAEWSQRGAAAVPYRWMLSQY